MKVNRSLAYIILSTLTLLSCGVLKKVNVEQQTIDIKYVANNDNYYEGNLIVKTLNVDGSSLNGTKVSVLSQGKLISELELSTSMGVFYVQENSIQIKVEKEGFDITKIERITMYNDSACMVNVKLLEK